MPLDCKPVFCKLPPDNIVQLKNILETYDGMSGELRTLCPKKGEVVILALDDTEKLVRELIASIADELSLREVPRPDSCDGDWLFAEE